MAGLFSQGSLCPKFRVFSKDINTVYLILRKLVKTDQIKLIETKETDTWLKGECLPCLIEMLKVKPVLCLTFNYTILPFVIGYVPELCKRNLLFLHGKKNGRISDL